MMDIKDNRCLVICYSIVLVVFFVVVLLGPDLLRCYLSSKIRQLNPDSELVKSWTKPDLPLYMKIYLFNWTNPEQVYDENFVPNLVEIGPYTFRDEFERVNITWNSNKTVSYRRRNTWYFDPSKSARSLTDKITMINPVALSASYITRNSIYLMQLSVSGSFKLTGQTLWVTKTAGELLFDGYDDPLVSIAAKLQSVNKGDIVYDKFGFFYMRNGSSMYEGVYNVDTGEDDFRAMGMMRSWNHNNRTDFYKAECGMVNGSDGSFYPPENPKDKPLEMFVTNFCRTLKFEYLDDVEVEGIPSHKYVGTKKLLDSGDIDPNNWCYCSGECIPHGALNISSCANNAPAFISYPHFLHGDPFYHRQVRGMHPDVEKHQFHIIVEPMTGFPLEVAGRFQFNFLMEPNENIGLFNNVPRIYFPMLWCEEVATITPEAAKGLKVLLAVPAIAFYIVTSVGVVLIALSVLVVVIIKSKKRDKEHKNRQEVYSFVLSEDQKPTQMPLKKREKEHEDSQQEYSSLPGQEQRLT